MSVAPARPQRYRPTSSRHPTVRSYNALVVLVPGVVTTTNDVVTGTSTTQFPIHGGRSNEGRLTLDGIIVGSPSNSPTSYVVDAGVTEEVTFAGVGWRERDGGLVEPRAEDRRQLDARLALSAGQARSSSPTT